MKKRTICVFALVALLLLLGSAFAEGVISTTVVMRVSRLTQDAVVDAGEDLSMEVNIEGVSPASYQWYFEGAPIAGANQRVYNIVNTLNISIVLSDNVSFYTIYCRRLFLPDPFSDFITVCIFFQFFPLCFCRIFLRLDTVSRRF